MQRLWRRHWRWVWAAPRQGQSPWSSQLGLGIGLVYLFLALQQWQQGRFSVLYPWMAGWLVPNTLADVLPTAWWRAAGMLRLTSEVVFVVGCVYGLWWLLAV
jgi:hypothetical protein